MFEVETAGSFSAAHSLRNCKGNGNHSRLHGHNWVVKVAAKSSSLDETGMAVDFGKLKNELDKILLAFNHCNLNEHPAFTVENPTGENIAAYIYREMSARVSSEAVKIEKVSVSESPDFSASFYTSATDG